MKIKLRSKMIIVNLSITVIVLFILILLLNMVYAPYFKLYKEQQLEKNMEKLEEILVNNNTDEINKYMDYQLKENQVMLYTMDEQLNITRGNRLKEPSFTVKTSQGDHKDIYGLHLPLTHFTVGEEVHLVCYRDSNTGKLFVESINGITQFEGKVLRTPSAITLESEPLNIEGTIISYADSAIDESELPLTISKTYQLMRNILGTIQDSNSLHTKPLKIRAGNQLTMAYKIGNDYIIGSTSIASPKELIKFINKFMSIIIIPHLTLAIIIIWIFSNGITRPLTKMIYHARDIAEENFETNDFRKTGDELEELGSSLNNIAIRLRDSMEVTKYEYEERLRSEKNQRFLLMNLSHDLKTPLTVIRGYLQAIKDNVYEKDEYIDYTIESVDMITKSLNDMLNLSRIKSPSFELKREITDVTRLIYQCYDHIKALFASKNQNVTFDLIDDAFSNIDPRELSIVIENLMVNSSMYSPTSATVYIKLLEKTDTTFLFSIENTGVHIPEDELQHVFTPYYRVEQSRNNTPPGSGLGLAFVDSILKHHEISYQLKNSSKGVIFNMYLQRVQE